MAPAVENNDQAKPRPTVAMDFDGVIHSYRSGWKGALQIPDPPVPGVREFIADLRKDLKVVIFSSRCNYTGGIKAIKEWLKVYDIKVDDVMAEKPPAIVLIDDRAIQFTGKFEGLADAVRNFVPWYNRKEV